MKIILNFFNKYLWEIILLDMIIVVIIILIIGARNFTHAQSTEKFTCNFPCARIFTITAYYSPKPSQQKYLTGSYESEIRLNGNGTNGADGTEVYAGMVAAPSFYPFGLKLDIPGIGISTVHDRGGAIVTGKNNGEDFDRLDVWMGYGDKGLERALDWGKRTMEVNILGFDVAIEDNVYLEGFSETEKIITELIPIFQPKYFKNNLGYGDSGEEVKKLQEDLKILGYYVSEITGIFEEVTYQAVLEFQIKNEIIDSEKEFGAGYFGPNTRRKFDFIWEKAKKEENDDLFSAPLRDTSAAEKIKKIQQILKDLGYFDSEITGIYDVKTIEAIFKFQRDKNIVKKESDVGAGYFGPETRKNLQAAWLNKGSKQENIKITEEVLAKYPDLKEDRISFAKVLQIGDSGEEVKILQEELVKLGYLRIEPTGYYGKVTAHAVTKLQQAWNLIKNEKSAGAGMIGPQTRSRLNLISENRLITKKSIALKREETQAQKLIAENKTEQEKNIFQKNLAYGDKDSEVKKLQEILKNAGYFNSPIITEYFGENTKKALIAFQMAKGIIASENDKDAGLLDETTRKEIQQISG